MKTHPSKPAALLLLAAFSGVALGQSVNVYSATTRIRGISDDGSVVVGAVTGQFSSNCAFWATNPSDYHMLDSASHGSVFDFGAPVVSGNGQVLMNTAATNNGNQGEYLIPINGNGGPVTSIIPPSGITSSAVGLSRDASVAVGYDETIDGSPGAAWRWTAVGGKQYLPMTAALGMSGDGSWVFGTDGSFQDAAWHNGVASRIPLPVGVIGGTSVNAANYNGDIWVGFSGGVISGVNLTVWHNGVGTSLPNLPGYSAIRATDVSEDGNVVLGLTVGTSSSNGIEPIRKPRIRC